MGSLFTTSEFTTKGPFYHGAIDQGILKPRSFGAKGLRLEGLKIGVLRRLYVFKLCEAVMWDILNMDELNCGLVVASMSSSL